MTNSLLSFEYEIPTRIILNKITDVCSSEVFHGLPNKKPVDSLTGHNNKSLKKKEGCPPN